MEAIGLREGVCQLCHIKVEKWLSAHHILGKEHDPDNQALIALCRGCHDVVTRLSARPWMERPDAVADLIALALARRGKTKAFVCVDIEDWTDLEIRDFSELINPTPRREARKITRRMKTRARHGGGGSDGPHESRLRAPPT